MLQLFEIQLWIQKLNGRELKTKPFANTNEPSMSK